MVDNSSIPDSNFMQNMLELGNNVLKVQENYNLIIEQNKSLEKEMKKQVIDMQADYIQHFLEFQNEIKEIKTENEANIKAIKQKNKEKYQQLETENKNRMEKLKEIIKEKEVKITSLDADIKQLYEMNSSSKKRNEELIFEFEQLSVKKQKTDQIIQSLETKIKQNENEYLNRIKLMEENVQQKEDKINSLDIQAKKVEVTEYLRAKKIPIECDPYGFWTGDNTVKWPILSKIATRFLSGPCTSAEAERKLIEELNVVKEIV
uniref:HAT C-terminal dimerisation domain-containing protein n=1 Tax=Meloidogyne javanica TaxID=6303 RepID=A0A915N585_MELJA